MKTKTVKTIVQPMYKVFTVLIQKLKKIGFTVLLILMMLPFYKLEKHSLVTK